MEDLFSIEKKERKASSYSAEDIQVLEGLEPVRKRPGMYIGGTDANAMHHLVKEIFDNAMDEVGAGYATKIAIYLENNNVITIVDNGRGIPIDPHPKFRDKSALEVIMTTLHSGGKFNDKVYQTSGGLHGVGISVVNALSDKMEVCVARDKTLWKQSYSRGYATSELLQLDKTNTKGTKISFHPDPEIFENIKFSPKKLYEFVKSKAYLFKGVEIDWNCEPSLLPENSDIPTKEKLKFPGGIADFITKEVDVTTSVTGDIFYGSSNMDKKHAKLEWAICWSENIDSENPNNSFCNTIPTPLGGTHDSGFKNALLKSIKSYAELTNNKKGTQIIVDDVIASSFYVLSVFISEPQFQGQTKEKLVSVDVQKLVETAVKDRFDHWLINNKANAEKLLAFIIEKSEERLSKKNTKDTNRKNFTSKICLPGKLADCTNKNAYGTEIFLVEGDSAGGSAKQARIRDNQAVLPLRGKILNVANASLDKIKDNQALADLEVALGCGVGKNYRNENLRYEKVIIMTDADVDGAHIASLLMTYFFIQMYDLIKNGHLYIAKPPLYRVVQGNKIYYPADDREKEKLITNLSKSKTHIEISRFKGLGEMTAAQLKETTMDPKKRTLIRVQVEEKNEASNHIDKIMGKKPETRLLFIQEQVQKNLKLIQESLDI